MSGNRNDLLQIVVVIAALAIWSQSRTRFGPVADVTLVMLAIGWRAFRSRNVRIAKEEEG